MFFFFEDMIFFEKKEFKLQLKLLLLEDMVVIEGKPISLRNNELHPRKGPSSLGKYMFQKF
jgi:hypothetical protein